MALPRIAAFPLAIAFLFCGQSPVAAAQPGDIDTSFSGDGVQRVDFGRTDYAHVAFVDDLGRLILGGASAFPLPDRVAMTRLLPNGRLDARFSDDGRVTVKPGSDATYVAAWTSDAQGRFLVLGGRETRDFADDAFYLLRLTHHGRLDPAFGTDGILRGKLGPGWNDVQDVIVLPSGRIVVVGNNGGDAVLKSYTAAGTVDSGFGGGDGIVRIPGLRAASLLYQPSGRLLVVGSRTHRRITVDAFSVSGRRDDSFGQNGRGTISVTDTGNLFVPPGSAAVGPNGQIVVGAELEMEFGLDTVVARFTRNGKPDLSFGSVGWRRFNLAEVDGPNAVVPLEDGRIVVVGEARRSLFGDDGSSDMYLLGLRTDGRKWLAFGESGVVRTDFGNGGDEVFGMDAREVNGRLIVVGGSRGNMLAARFFVSGR